MIKQVKDLRVDDTMSLKGGIGVTRVLHFFEEENFYGKGRLYGISILAPGCSIGEHTHAGDQEAYFILEGKAEYVDNGVVSEIGPGTLTLCKDGDSHSIKNIGDIDLRYIAFIMFTN